MEIQTDDNIYHFEVSPVDFKVVQDYIKTNKAHEEGNMSRGYECQSADFDKNLGRSFSRGSSNFRTPALR